MNFISFKNWINESENNIFYHGSTDMNLSEKNGIHIGTYKVKLKNE